MKLNDEEVVFVTADGYTLCDKEGVELCGTNG